MQVRLLTLFLVSTIAFNSCNQEGDDPLNCLDQDTTASFTVNGASLTVTHTPVWTSSGIYNSLGFRHDLAGGGQHIVTIIFEGDTAGTYSLAGQLDPNRALYLGPASNNQSFFSDPNQPGMLTITDIDTENGCLSGSYSFTANFLQISGEFQSLRPD